MPEIEHDVYATALRRRLILERIEWMGRLFLDDAPSVRRCVECGQAYPNHGKSCALKAELAREP